MPSLLKQALSCPSFKSRKGIYTSGKSAPYVLTLTLSFPPFSLSLSLSLSLSESYRNRRRSREKQGAGGRTGLKILRGLYLVRVRFPPRANSQSSRPTGLCARQFRHQGIVANVPQNPGMCLYVPVMCPRETHSTSLQPR